MNPNLLRQTFLVDGIVKKKATARKKLRERKPPTKVFPKVTSKVASKSKGIGKKRTAKKNLDCRNTKDFDGDDNPPTGSGSSLAIPIPSACAAPTVVYPGSWITVTIPVRVRIR